MKHVTVTTPIKLTPAEIEGIKQQLKVTSTDQFSVEVNITLIAGIKIVIDGKALDLSVKRQLAEIVGNN